jgi:hypothetical protein
MLSLRSILSRRNKPFKRDKMLRKLSMTDVGFCLFLANYLLLLQPILLQLPIQRSQPDAQLFGYFRFVAQQLAHQLVDVARL